MFFKSCSINGLTYISKYLCLTGTLSNVLQHIQLSVSLVNVNSLYAMTVISSVDKRQHVSLVFSIQAVTLLPD